MAKKNEESNEYYWSYEVLKQFRAIFKAVQQHSQILDAQFGISAPQLWILWELSNNKGMKVTELAQKLSIHNSTTSNLLNKLAKKKLIHRERISEDQRVVTLHLTTDGHELLEKASQLSPRGILQQSLFDLSEDTLISLFGNMDVLITKMEINVSESVLEPIVFASKK